MITQTRRLTLFLPIRLHEMVERAARERFSRPSEYARSILAAHIATAERKPAGKREIVNDPR
jgi:hypothetical protein